MYMYARQSEVALCRNIVLVSSGSQQHAASYVPERQLWCVCVLSQDIDIATELVSHGFARWRRPPTPACASSDADDAISARSGAASVAASVSDAQEEVVASS